MQTGVERRGEKMHVPPPPPPDEPGAWYAPGVCAQYEVYPGVVVTVHRTDTDVIYDVREPGLTGRGERALQRITDQFLTAPPEPPRTRSGVVDRMQGGFSPKYEREIERVLGEALACTPWRRVEYHALARVGGVGRLTPFALDERLTERTVTDDELVVGTCEYPTMQTGVVIDGDRRSRCKRLLSERCHRYTVSFMEYEIPVVVYRERDSPFTRQYAVCEPDLLPGDVELLAACKQRLWEMDVSELHDRDRIAFVRERAEQLLSRLLTARATSGRVASFTHRFRAALSVYGLLDPPATELLGTDRLDSLLYYVLRDFIGYERLTIPIHDDRLEDIEANRVGERIKVIPRGGRRMPTNLCFGDGRTFNNVVRQLAAADGVELNASTPSAKVNLDPIGVEERSTEETVRCALALGIISEDGPHISIRKQRSDPLTPVELVQNNSIPPALVALLWLVFEHHGVVLFSGPTGVGKTTLMNAHIPFISHTDRPISIDEGSREVWLPHETGVSLRTREHQARDKRVTMADLMTESNYLNPDVEIIAEINTPESFATFGESILTGHGIIGTTHAGTIERLTNRIIEQGLPPHLLAEIDLVVFPRHVDGERYVGEVVELVSDPDSIQTTTIARDGVEVAYNTVFRRTPRGGFTFAYNHPALGDSKTASRLQLFERLADRANLSAEAVEASFRQKHRFVESLCEQDVTGMDELFDRLARVGGGDER